MKGISLEISLVVWGMFFALLIATAGYELMNVDDRIKSKTVDTAASRVDGAVALVGALSEGAEMQIDMDASYSIERRQGDLYIVYDKSPFVPAGNPYSRLMPPVDVSGSVGEPHRFFCLSRGSSSVRIEGGKC